MWAGDFEKSQKKAKFLFRLFILPHTVNHVTTSCIRSEDAAVRGDPERYITPSEINALQDEVRFLREAFPRPLPLLSQARADAPLARSCPLQRKSCSSSTMPSDSGCTTARATSAGCLGYCTPTKVSRLAAAANRVFVFLLCC